MGLGIRLFALPFFVLPFAFAPQTFLPLNMLSWNFWLPVLVVSFVLTPIETYFYYRAIRLEEISLALPIDTLDVVIATIIAALFLREIPTLPAIVGIACMFIGIYLLKSSRIKEGPLAPLKALTSNRAVRMMLIVTVSVGISRVLDKLGLQASNVFMYGLVNYVLVSISLSFFAVKYARHDLGQLLANYKQFLLLGSVVASYTFLYFFAVQLTQLGYATAVRNTSVLFTIILGVLVLKEKEWRSKIVAGIVLVIGLILIKVYG